MNCVPYHDAGRNRGDLDEDEDAYLVPSDWEDDGDDEDWGGGTAAKRARDLERNLKEVRACLRAALWHTLVHSGVQQCEVAYCYSSSVLLEQYAIAPTSVVCCTYGVYSTR